MGHKDLSRHGQQCCVHHSSHSCVHFGHHGGKQEPSDHGVHLVHCMDLDHGTDLSMVRDHVHFAVHHSTVWSGLPWNHHHGSGHRVLPAGFSGEGTWYQCCSWKGRGIRWFHCLLVPYRFGMCNTELPIGTFHCHSSCSLWFDGHTWFSSVVHQ